MPVPNIGRRQFAVSATTGILAATAGVFYGSRDLMATVEDVISVSE